MNNTTNTSSIGHRFFAFSGLVLLGVLALAIALQIMSQIWGWIVLAAAVAVAAVIGWRLYRHHASRW